MKVPHFTPGLLPLVLLLAGCSGDPQPSASEQPSEPVSAQSAFGGMFASARSWAADVQPLRVSQIDVEGAKAQGGKAVAWEAVFVSPGTGRVRRFTYSVVHQPARNLRRGVGAEPPQAWSGGSGSAPFNVLAFRKDSTAAYELAMEKGREYAAKHAGQPVKCMLEKTDRFPDPAWRVFWGDSVSTSGFSVFMDATTGDYLGTSR